MYLTPQTTASHIPLYFAQCTKQSAQRSKSGTMKRELIKTFAHNVLHPPGPNLISFYPAIFPSKEII